ncbi:MAG: LytTR family DNA-binding domain-containing protein [Bryobacteraceae bacterium]
MIRAVVVDDEDPARAHLRRLLEAEAGIQVIAEARNGLEALEQIAEHAPDVAFLDIEMPGLNGLEVARQLGETPPRIVFATAYDQFAVKAFEANAADYLLKPIQADRVKKTVERLRQAFDIGGEPSHAPLREVLAELHPRISKLAVRRGKRILLLAPADILHISIDDKLVFAHTTSDRFLVDRTISELEDMLGGAGFLRIGRGDLVQLDQVQELMPWFSGTWRLKLKNGVELDVSRERAKDLKQRLGL